MLSKHKSQKLVGFLAYKTKVQTADFKVNEIVDVAPQPKGQFILYRLTKEGWNTVDALIRIAKASRINLTDIDFGGKKFLNGITSQY
ncbi:MAG: tRNA pseudouridine(13) synthase TruD, partial [Leptonema sp. (in: Bacteria)]|nr:tRNA pseudouridine(13) synthase TruD [Leptonema sp. (in: bacteria)]